MPVVVAVGLLLLSYLIGGIPFGYLIARAKGVDLFKAGSGNIGATNVGRVLGRGYGVLVFALDFLKGAVPVAAIVPLAGLVNADAPTALGHPDALRVGAALAAFLGHLLPVYLRFRGGKGVATGAGVMAVLVPVPFAVSLVGWVVVTLATRYVSVGSVLATTFLLGTLFLVTPDPSGPDHRIVTAFCLLGCGLVVVKHRANVRRLLAGTESLISDGPKRQALTRGIHVVAVGVWFGAGLFFNFIAAPSFFESYRQVVETQPNDRTANVRILPDDAQREQRDALARALAGAAVGPLFPRFFALCGVCAVAAVPTAFGFRRATVGKFHRLRWWACATAAVLLAVSWPLSEYLSHLRVLRFDADTATALAAQSAFAAWHTPSVVLSGLMTLCVGVALATAGRMPVPADAERAGEVAFPLPPDVS